MRAGQQWEACESRTGRRPSGAIAGELGLGDGAAERPGRSFRSANRWDYLGPLRLPALLSTLNGAPAEVEAVGGALSPESQCGLEERRPCQGDPAGSPRTELALWGDSHFFQGPSIPGQSRRRCGHRVLSGETQSGKGRADPNSLGEPSGIGPDHRGRRAPVAPRAAERPEEQDLGGRGPCPGWGRLPSESAWPAGRRRATPKPAGGEHFKAGDCGGWAPERFRAQRSTGRRGQFAEEAPGDPKCSLLLGRWPGLGSVGLASGLWRWSCWHCAGSPRRWPRTWSPCPGAPSTPSE